MSEIQSYNRYPLSIIFKTNKEGEIIEELSSVKSIPLFFEVLSSEEIADKEKIKEVQKQIKEDQKLKLRVGHLNVNYAIKDIYLIQLYIPIASKNIKQIIVQGGVEVDQKKKGQKQKRKKINIIQLI